MKNSMKKVFAILLAVAMVFSGNSLMVSAETTTTSDANSVTIQVLSTSDLHGRFVPYDYAINAVDNSGSLAQVASVVKSLRNDNTLLLDVGDTIQDNSADLFLKDDLHPMIAGMNALGYDTWTVGNHEFNYGMDTLKKVIKQSKATVLGGNVYNTDGTSIAAPYKIFEKNGVKIAVVGMVTPNITKWDAQNLKSYKVTDPVKETKKVIDQIKDKVDVIIAAEHMGESNEYDVADSGIKDLAAACPEIDLIVAAHEHKGVEGVYYNNVLTVENKSGGQTVSKVDITLEKGADGKYVVKNRNSKLISTSTYKADPDMTNILAKYDTTAKADANVVIGKLKDGDLVPANEINGIPQAQLQESAMINLINQVQMYYTGAEVSAAAMFNSNANMKAGDIKKCDTALIYKYANTLYKVQMTGAQLKKYMEWSATYYNTYKDGDLTISFNPDVRAYNYDMFSGVKYDVNVSKEPGSRIENLRRMNGKAIKDTDVLIVAVNNYRANSQLLSYGPIFKEGEALPKLLATDVKSNIGGVRELIRDYITNVKKGVIKPELSGNWKVTGNTWNRDLHQKAAELINTGKITLPVSADGRTPNVKAITKADIAQYVTIAAPAQATMKSVKSKKAKTAVVTLNDMLEAEGYEISYSTDKNFVNDVKTITTDKNVATLTGLKSKKTYYVKVRALRKDFTETVLFGDYSTVMSVKVK
ncbi:5'-nucleotidase C-terminal domain-containing protein [Anaeromicropila herbilytica]|uniref:2',3'-cyclic-nucleotide 2'-phosphodiesterase n=1 Tax=Anaeromicropila herbilytica TaxID=2785025 RepID=A0A7R7EKP6_9FIRM|nr:5'-nucleotidase C-terminal domain-containing protein [Anaeromicropila herbilytica]BCN30600.1 2',3'-cyclic-nucleotide 2'-phosphodiesterase [Anaeromicropila herbilytica]